MGILGRGTFRIDCRIGGGPRITVCLFVKNFLMHDVSSKRWSIPKCNTREDILAKSDDSKHHCCWVIQTFTESDVCPKNHSRIKYHRKGSLYAKIVHLPTTQAIYRVSVWITVGQTLHKGTNQFPFGRRYSTLLLSAYWTECFYVLNGQWTVLKIIFVDHLIPQYPVRRLTCLERITYWLSKAWDLLTLANVACTGFTWLICQG